MGHQFVRRASLLEHRPGLGREVPLDQQPPHTLQRQRVVLVAATVGALEDVNDLPEIPLGHVALPHRLMLVRQKQESNLVVKLTEALARFIPLLDTTRLRANFRRAALDWSVGTFVAVSLGAGCVIAAFSVFASGKPLYVVLMPGLFSGMVAVDRFVKFRGARRANRFMKQLPDALDTIIRGIRSGLPVIECIGGVGQEYDDPVGTHFRAISERVMLGNQRAQPLLEDVGIDLRRRDIGVAE